MEVSKITTSSCGHLADDRTIVFRYVGKPYKWYLAEENARTTTDMEFLVSERRPVKAKTRGNNHLLRQAMRWHCNGWYGMRCQNHYCKPHWD